jgi:hypothetical protein
VRNDQAALTNDYVVRDVDKVVDLRAGADLSCAMPALIYARVGSNVHIFS